MPNPDQRAWGAPHTLTRRGFLQAAMGTTGLVLLSACGGTPSPSPTAASKAPEAKTAAGKTTVMFSAAGDAKSELPVFQSLANAFNSKSDKVEVQVQPFPEGGFAKALAMLEAKDAPDIIRVEDDAAYFVGKSGHVADLTQYYERDFKKIDDYYSFFFQESHVEGKQFAFTANHTPPLFFYNEDHFKEAGLTAPTKWTDAWDFPTFLAAAQKLGKKNGEVVERYAAYIDNWDECLPYAAGVGFFNHDQTKCTLDDPRMVDVLKTFVDLTVKQKLMVPPGENHIELFNSGQLSMMGTIAHQAQVINPEVKWKWMPYPKFKKWAMGSGYGRTFVVPKYGPSKNPEAAWEFLKFWATEEGSTMIAKQPWGVPPNKKGSDGLLKDPRWADKNVGLWIEALDWTFPRNMTPMRFGTIRNLWQNQPKLDDLRVGKLDPETFIKSVVTEVDAEIQRLNWKHVPPPLADKAPHDKSLYARWYYLGADKADDPRK